MKLFNTLALVITLYTSTAMAQPVLVDPQSGKFLGTLSANVYDPNSISNPYGRYGNPYSPDSVNNPYGEYGSVYSDRSANNPYATSAPIVVSPYDLYE